MTMIEDTFGRLPARLLTLAFALLCPQATAAPAVGEGGASIADKEFEVIQIIGTHIRGVEEGASPVFVFSREDIEATGFSLTHQFIQHVPQNFSGGASETNANLGADGIVTNGGTGLNLRGLGSDSSLVLLNGHRVAPGGRGEFTDIGMFPLSAIEQIELMSDGASAIYGSDAVGGVVNFILRDQFQGAESRIRYGTTSEDSVDELQLGQTFGHSWLEGDALVSYEYYQRDHLFARDRHFTRELNDPYSLLPKVERHTLFLAGTRHIGTWLTLSGDGLFSRRDNSSYQATTPTGPGRPDNTREDVEQVIAGMKVTVELNESWSLDLGGSYSHNKSRSESRYLETDSGGEPPKGHKESVVWSIDAISDGIVLSLPGGYSRLAIGGHFRHEGYRDFQSLERWGVETDTDRDIYGALTEWFIPVVGPNNRLPGAERLELTLAVRYEDYSDVGETTDPKVGVLWSPLAELDLRATWGTSFRAPLLVELLEVTNIVGLMNLDDPSSTSPSGRTLALTAFGQNPHLKPETATTWTVGFNFRPNFLPGFDLRLTYFDVDFQDRITSVLDGYNAFIDPRYAALVNRNPSPAEIEELLAYPFLNYTAFEIPERHCCGPPADLSDSFVIIDNRLRNTAISRTRGLDLGLSYSLATYAGSWRFSLAGTYLLEKLRRISQHDSGSDILNTVRNPADLKLRAGVSWSRADLAAHFFINYIGSYRDEGVQPAERVDAWIPLDLNLSYLLREGKASFGGGLLENIRFSLTAHNLLDEEPPFVSDAKAFVSGLYFDANNANPLGRFVSLTLTKEW